MDLIDLYDRASAWTASKIPAAADQLDAATPCEQWTVKDILNHIVAGQAMFAGGATGQGPSGPPSGMPPDVLAADPVEQYETERQKVLEAYRTNEGALEQGGMLLGIGVVDQLVHGWDLATATGQDATMPADLAEVAWSQMEGRLPPEGRGDVFAPAVEVAADASTQDKLIGYMGRDPS